MKQWQISELESRDMRDIHSKNIVFHFCDEVADRIEAWCKKLRLDYISRFEDCRTNHFFYIVNGDLMYLNTDDEREICYILANGFTVINITEDIING